MYLRDFKYFWKNIKKCKPVMLSGAGFHQPEGTIQLNSELYATTSIGNVKENQEDAVVLAIHPKFGDKYKLLAVADGIGGGPKGEEASNLVLTELKKWFTKLKNKEDFSMDNLQYEIKKLLNKTHKKINEIKEGNMSAGTTLVCAIVGENDTMIVNVGNSRAYTYKNKKIEQVSKEQTVLRNMIDQRMVDINDKDIRFHKLSNKISQALGAQNENLEIAISVIDNNAYEALLLFSDGVTDCLTDDSILAITKYTDKNHLTQKLVEIALNTNSRKRAGLGKNYKDEIQGGFDNTTAAVYYPDRDEK